METPIRDISVGGGIAGIVFEIILTVVAAILGVILFAHRSLRSEKDKEKLSNGVSFIPHAPLAAEGKVYYLLLNFGSLQAHLFSHSF